MDEPVARPPGGHYIKGRQEYNVRKNDPFIRLEPSGPENFMT